MYQYPNKKKMLKGFHFILKEDIDIADLKCYSYVSSVKWTRPFPEVDAFAWVKLKDVNKILNKSQQDFIKDIWEGA
jgi:predicted NUDIX family NTP pyrophosphohydrolase